jgi:hypothetical protein
MEKAKKETLDIKKRLIGTIIAPMILMGGSQYMDGIRFPSMTAGCSKYVPGNGGDGLTEEEKARNKAIDERKRLKKEKKLQ